MLLLCLFLLLQLIRHVLILPVLKDLVEILHAFGREKTNVIDQCADSTSGVSSATEPEEEDLVSRLPVVAEKTIAFTNMLGDGMTGCSTDHLVNDASICADAVVVVDNLGM